jgi:hypothetical protein
MGNKLCGKDDEFDEDSKSFLSLMNKAQGFH